MTIQSFDILKLIYEQTNSAFLDELITELSRHFKQKLASAGCNVSMTSDRLDVYAEYKLFYPGFSNLSLSEQLTITLKYVKKFVKVFKKTEISSFKDSRFITIIVSSLTQKFYDNTHFSNDDSILDICLGVGDEDYPDGVVVGIRFISGLSSEHIVRGAFSYMKTEMYRYIIDELKTIINLTAKAIRNNNLE